MQPPDPFACPDRAFTGPHVFSPDEECDQRLPPARCEHCGATPEEVMQALPPEIAYVMIGEIGEQPTKFRRSAAVRNLRRRRGSATLGPVAA